MWNVHICLKLLTFDGSVDFKNNEKLMLFSLSRSIQYNRKSKIVAFFPQFLIPVYNILSLAGSIERRRQQSFSGIVVSDHMGRRDVTMKIHFDVLMNLACISYILGQNGSQTVLNNPNRF